MSIIKWVTLDFSTRIERVEVERETEQSVWINGRRHAKSGWRAHHDTWDLLMAETTLRANAKVCEKTRTVTLTMGLAA